MRAFEAITAATALAALCSCEFSDPLIVTDNGEGIQLVDAQSGVGGNSRTICLVRQRSSDGCSSRTADVYIRGVPQAEQVWAEWRDDDPRIVDVFVFGGHVVRCDPEAKRGEVRIMLRQLPADQLPPSGWGTTSKRLFLSQPDRCGQVS